MYLIEDFLLPTGNLSQGAVADAYNAYGQGLQGLSPTQLAQRDAAMSQLMQNCSDAQLNRQYRDFLNWGQTRGSTEALAYRFAKFKERLAVALAKHRSSRAAG